MDFIDSQDSDPKPWGSYIVSLFLNAPTGKWMMAVPYFMNLS